MPATVWQIELESLLLFNLYWGYYIPKKEELIQEGKKVLKEEKKTTCEN